MRAYFLWLFKFLTVLIVVFVLLPLVIGVIVQFGNSSSGAGLSRSKKTVSVVELTGIIRDSKDVLEDLYREIEDPQVQGIVLRVDSPGGAVGPSQEINAAVKNLKAKKPIVASMGAVAASGGLYATLSASKVFCQPGTMTGSIGVILEIPNFSKVTDKIGVDMVTIKSGKFKDVGNSFRPMTDEERDFLQSTVLAAYEEFVSAVADGRSIDRESVKEFADGRVILGSQAKDLKLVDDFGDVVDAARAVFELSGQALAPGEMPKLHYPADDKFEKIARALESFTNLPAIMESGPRLQYLFR